MWWQYHNVSLFVLAPRTVPGGEPQSSGNTGSGDTGKLVTQSKRTPHNMPGRVDQSHPVPLHIHKAFQWLDCEVPSLTPALCSAPSRRTEEDLPTAFASCLALHPEFLWMNWLIHAKHKVTRHSSPLMPQLRWGTLYSTMCFQKKKKKKAFILTHSYHAVKFLSCKSQLGRKLGCEHQAGHNSMSLGAGRVQGYAKGPCHGSLGLEFMTTLWVGQSLKHWAALNGASQNMCSQNRFPGL